MSLKNVLTNGLKNFLGASLGLIVMSHLSTSYAHLLSEPRTRQLVLADLHVLKAIGARTLAENQSLNLGYGVVTDEQANQISTFNHANGKCGGYESIASLTQVDISNLGADLTDLEERSSKELLYSQMSIFEQKAEIKPEIVAAIAEVKEENLRATVEWLSSYSTRFNKGPNPNEHVLAMKDKVEALFKGTSLPAEVEIIEHRSTPQKSLRVRILGSKRPDEIIVLGAHLDSINQSFGGDRKAPGADDNASGSSNIFEALRILVTKAQPERTVEFFWYAGEESGLLGSAEIANTYKQANKKVIAVMQLDMTLFPGEGETTIGSVTDFTSSWLRDYLKAINDSYLHLGIVEFACGYGCSDHASWYHQGFPSFIPFEASMKTMNHSLHTPQDIISPKLSFAHSTYFSKIAVIFAMDLGNSTQSQPY